MFPANLPRPLRLGLYAGVVAVLLWLCLTPSANLPTIDLWDKIEHALAWIVLTGMGLALSPRRPRAIVAFAFALGAFVEVAQSLMGQGRQGDLLDLLADAIGIAAATALYAFSRRARQ